MNSITVAEATAGTLNLSVDGVPLKVKLRRAERARKMRYLALIAPLALFVLVLFVWPLGALLQQSVANPEVSEAFPRTVAALAEWDGDQPPADAAYDALAADLTDVRGTRTLAVAAKRLNMERTGLRSLLMRSARAMPPAAGQTPREALLSADAHWGKPDVWRLIAHNSARWTPYYLLTSVDLTFNDDGSIVNVPEEKAVFRTILARTLWMSVIVTVCCLLLGYPLAYLAAILPQGKANLILILVLLPFWTSLLVRMAAWIVLLQNEGLINRTLMALGLVDAPVQLVFNRIGVYIAMVHILLPFAVLPLYSVMKGIPPTLRRAALSLGCPPFQSFWKVYFPLTLPGVGAGGLLVFILCMGYYITPALLGGPQDQMASYYVAFYTNETINWGMAAALSSVLLVATLVLYVFYARYFGPARTDRT